MCINFVQPEHYKNEKLYTLNVFDPHVLLPIENVSVGAQRIDILKDFENSLVKQFKLKCVTFYQKAVDDALKRFPIKHIFFRI